MKNILGAHTSVEGGVSKAIDLAEKLQFDAVQIFTKNASRWSANPLPEKEIISFKEKLERSKIDHTFSHDSYLINLCAANDDLLKKSRTAFKDEILRCDQLGIPYLVFHPGAHMGMGEEKGLEMIANSLNLILNELHDRKVICLLETTAGQGSALGFKFEHLKSIIDKVEDKRRVGVCLDTAHIFAAGYDLRSEDGYKKTFSQFDEIIGLDLLKCIHINDSKKELGSRVDRHEHIGKGFIGEEGFRNLMNDERLRAVPMILETPKTKGQLEDCENIRVLRSLVTN